MNQQISPMAVGHAAITRYRLRGCHANREKLMASCQPFAPGMNEFKLES